MATWYTDMEAMRADDAMLQSVYIQLRKELSVDAQQRTAAVHVYPSQR